MALDAPQTADEDRVAEELAVHRARRNESLRLALPQKSPNVEEQRRRGRCRTRRRAIARERASEDRERGREFARLQGTDV
jgi:hypothetical protein